MTTTVRARYTLEFKQEAVRLAAGGQRIAATSTSLGVVEISRLRAELAGVKMERDILGQATAVQAACAEPG